MAYNIEDIKRNEEEGKMSAILTIEDGRSIDGKLKRLKNTMTWGKAHYPNLEP